MNNKYKKNCNKQVVKTSMVWREEHAPHQTMGRQKIRGSFVGED